MNIGNAIKVLRKKKGYSQKQLADMCGISVNALCQIEVNNSFPQKATIKSLCEALNIPTSYLLFFCISDEDIPEDKRQIFNTVGKSLKDLLLQGL